MTPDEVAAIVAILEAFAALAINTTRRSMNLLPTGICRKSIRS
jgi:hypothetical protein